MHSARFPSSRIIKNVPSDWRKHDEEPTTARAEVRSAAAVLGIVRCSSCSSEQRVAESKCPDEFRQPGGKDFRGPADSPAAKPSSRFRRPNAGQFLRLAAVPRITAQDTSRSGSELQRQRNRLPVLPRQGGLQHRIRCLCPGYAPPGETSCATSAMPRLKPRRCLLKQSGSRSTPRGWASRF